MTKKGTIARPTEKNVTAFTKPAFFNWVSKSTKIRMLKYLRNEVGCVVALKVPAFLDIDPGQNMSTNLTKIDDGFVVKTGPRSYIVAQEAQLKSKGCDLLRYELI